MKNSFSHSALTLSLLLLLHSKSMTMASMTNDVELKQFSGRISRINSKAKLMRVRISFSNVRYLNRGDIVEFTTEDNKTIRCKGIIKGKTNDYLLVRIPNIDACSQNVSLTVGAYVWLESQDLLKNIQTGQEVIEILLKKRMALKARKKRLNRELKAYTSRVDAINSRFEVLQKKLMKEWRESLSEIEEDKSLSLRQYKNTEIRLDDIEYKLEQYKISDNNLELDRWSLDHRLYFKK